MFGRDYTGFIVFLVMNSSLIALNLADLLWLIYYVFETIFLILEVKILACCDLVFESGHNNGATFIRYSSPLINFAMKLLTAHIEQLKILSEKKS